MITIGTSGYYYKDWIGHFYPDGTRKEEMLALYSKHFNAVELNFTYYGIPKPESFSRMLENTPGNFEFVVKANREMTHEPGKEDAFAMFDKAIAPLKKSGRFGGVLAQFPWSFRNTPGNRSYLYYFRERMPDIPLIVEFRHNSWQNEEVFDFLRETGISCCSVDEPDIRDLPDRRPVFTCEPAYVRFHSRDADKWYGGDGKERYNYLYRQEELEEWIPKIRDLAGKAKKVYVFFNNCHGAQAVENARRLGQLLELW